jgi:hypothetical protein
LAKLCLRRNGIVIANAPQRSLATLVADDASHDVI